jgi:hypothetical protein
LLIFRYFGRVDLNLAFRKKNKASTSPAPLGIKNSECVIIQTRYSSVILCSGPLGKGLLSIDTIMTKDKLSISIISKNARGLQAKVKRRACLRQISLHGDVALIQDTHCDANLMTQIKTEFPGEWLFSNGTNFKAGVAIGILKLFGIDVVKDSFFNEGSGRLIGVGLKANNKLIYVIKRLWSMCTDNQDKSY